MNVKTKLIAALATALLTACGGGDYEDDDKAIGDAVCLEKRTPEGAQPHPAPSACQVGK